MAVRDEIREERKKLKGQGFQAYLEYFWDYYKLHAIAVVALIIVIAVVIKDVRNNKPYAFYAMMLNSGASMAQDTIQDSFAEYASIDTKEYSCLVDTSSSFDPLILDQMAVATSQKIMAVLSAKELDVMTGDLRIMLHYGNQETFLDLREVYSEDELKSLEDRLIYVDQAYLDYLNSDDYQTYLSTGEYDENNKLAVKAHNYNQSFIYELESPDAMDNPIPVAIRLDGSQFLSENGIYYGQEAAASIIINSQHTDTAKQFIEFLLK
ncbi:hypothetical protein [Butyrivibrio sp. MC2021]|uniref:hypothetical protein n=1 Tax=Butyrivibrio sp. MC2021 TaxID=1408306 RepID=UPI0004786C41|nr:hypothetical protein [Butyrivibrio sp. MC2021]